MSALTSAGEGYPCGFPLQSDHALEGQAAAITPLLEYAWTYRQTKDYGASFAAMCALAARKGYRLIHVHGPLNLHFRAVRGKRGVVSSTLPPGGSIQPEVLHPQVTISARDRNRGVFASPFGAVYDFYIQRERLSQLIARLVWHSDTRPFYASMAAIRTAPDGSTVVDAPCGSGVALRALSPGQKVRYLGFDLSPEMLGRARRRAEKLRLAQVELAEADAESLPVDDGSAALFLSYFGLHCFPDPAAALREASRCLRLGGRLVGSMIVLGTRPLDGFRVRPSAGAYGPVGTASDLREWLVGAGLVNIALEVRGVFAYFEARKRD